MARIYGAHKVRDWGKVEALATSMAANGWQGAPIVLLDDTQAMTGVHRLAACAQAEIEPETVLLDDLLTEEQRAELAEVLASLDSCDSRDLAIEAGRWVCETLPELAEQYGIQQG